MTSAKNTLRQQLMALRFSIWDLHLYLDTHPNDSVAAELVEKYMERYAVVLRDYECKYGPLTSENAYGEAWTKGPWPWDNRAGEN